MTERDADRAVDGAFLDCTAKFLAVKHSWKGRYNRLVSLTFFFFLGVSILKSFVKQDFRHHY